MSRSISITSKKDVSLTIRDFIDKLSELSVFNDSELKILHDGCEILSNSSDKVYLNTGLTIFRINDSGVFINCYNDTENTGCFTWCIESRALKGIDRSLFIATASVIADLTDGLACSGDGAWDCTPGRQFQGSELWNEYLRGKVPPPHFI